MPMKVEVTCCCGATLVVDGKSFARISVIENQVRAFNEEHTVCRIAASNRKPAPGARGETE